MRYALMLEPQQGLSYEEQLAVARVVEAAGFEGLLRSDHYASFPGASDNPTSDAWPASPARRDASAWGRSSRRSPSASPGRSPSWSRRSMP